MIWLQGYFKYWVRLRGLTPWMWAADSSLVTPQWRGLATFLRRRLKEAVADVEISKEEEIAKASTGAA
jgi:hypothetical protein